MGLFARLKSRFAPQSRVGTGSHYIQSQDYGYEPVQLAVWRSNFKKPVQDWRGNAGRIPDNQVLTAEGELLFATKGVTTQPISAYSGLFLPGTMGTYPVAGNAGRPAQITPYSAAAEYNANNATSVDAVIQATQGE